VLDEAITVCRSAGFEDVLLRGDTDFTMSSHVDRWDDDSVRFVLGYDATRRSWIERETCTPATTTS